MILANLLTNISFSATTNLYPIFQRVNYYITTYVATKNEPKVAIPSEYLYKQPSSNERISYTLVSITNHDGDSLDCGHYVSDVFDISTGIWWHCDDDNITQISGLPKGVYYRETNKHIKKKLKNDVRINRCISCFLYENNPSDKTQLKKYQEFTAMSKITHIKKVIEDQYFFRTDIKVIQEVNDEIKTSISYIKDELKISI